VTVESQQLRRFTPTHCGVGDGVILLVGVGVGVFVLVGVTVGVFVIVGVGVGVGTNELQSPVYSLVQFTQVS
jgi:hypothetical protein